MLLSRSPSGRPPSSAGPSPPRPSPPLEPSIPPTTPPTTISQPAAVGVFKVDLDNPTDYELFIVVDDETGSVVDVTSGQPGDGMSVRWFDLKTRI